MTYAYPANINGLADLALWMNSVTSGYFWPLILLGLFVILFISTRAFGFERSIAYSSFITAIIAILLGIIGLVNIWIVTLTIIIASASALVLRNANNKEY